jgi:hypothetical protein
VSTERITSKRSEIVAATRPSGVYETRDFYLACFLRFVGYELLDLRPEGRRRVFVFQDRQARHDDVMAFYSDGAAVQPLAFSSTIKDMKALLHNA